MGAKVRIEHNSKGWAEIFTSAEMQAVVDEAGERIAAEAGEHFHYAPATHSNFTAAGFVASDAHTGAYLEATHKVLTKAVHK
jgi:hypothetical protein